MDEQYGSLQNLSSSTCLADADLEKLPTLVVILSQELREYKYGTGSDHFPKYVNAHSLIGYTLVGVCSDVQSAQSAVFIRSEFASHVYPGRLECIPVAAGCDYLNC